MYIVYLLPRPFLTTKRMVGWTWSRPGHLSTSAGSRGRGASATVVSTTRRLPASRGSFSRPCRYPPCTSTKLRGSFHNICPPWCAPAPGGPTRWRSGRGAGRRAGTRWSHPQAWSTPPCIALVIHNLSLTMHLSSILSYHTYPLEFL